MQKSLTICTLEANVASAFLVDDYLKMLKNNIMQIIIHTPLPLRKSGKHGMHFIELFSIRTVLQSSLAAWF